MKSKQIVRLECIKTLKKIITSAKRGKNIIDIINSPLIQNLDIRIKDAINDYNYSIGSYEYVCNTEGYKYFMNYVRDYFDYFNENNLKALLNGEVKPNELF